MLIYTKVPSKPRKKAKKVVKARKPRQPFKEKAPPVVTKYQAPGTQHIKSHIHEFLATVAPKNPVPVRYEGAMAAREAAAQAEKQRKAKTVAPAYNKGPLQPVTSPEQAKWVGRK